LAERYFNGMDDYFYVEEPKLLEWMAVLEEKYPISSNSRSEFEIKQDIDGIQIMAKYDLLLVEDEGVKIVDFKTNEKEYVQSVVEDGIQTKVYMYILGENLKKMFPNLELGDISMEYFQLNFPKSRIQIKYSDLKHKKNKIFLQNLIEKIEVNKKTFFDKGSKTCEKCGFVSFCKK
jgi:hypothetical protein